MKTIGIIAIVLLGFVFLGVVGITGYLSYVNTALAEQNAAKVSKYDVGPVDKTELLELVNKERVKTGAQPLVDNPVLDESAAWKAQDMATRNYFAHKVPGIDKEYDQAHMDTQSAVCADTVSENLVLPGKDGTSRDSIYSWMTSTMGHREALLNPTRNLTGIGIAKSSDGVYYVAELFCTAR